MSSDTPCGGLVRSRIQLFESFSNLVIDSRPATFRLLSLPPEIRIQIYEHMAINAFQVPAKVAYFTCMPRRFGIWSVTTLLDVKSAKLQHDLRRRGHCCRNRLALLYTSRKIYQEASRVFYSRMALDLRGFHLTYNQVMVATLIATFKHKLQFVRHIELDYVMLDSFLDATTTPGFAHPYRKSTGLASFHWPLDLEPPATIRRFTRLRTYFFALESITAYAAPNRRNGEGWAIGVDLMYSLGHDDGSGCWPIPRLFPRLKDIRLISVFGSERFRRTGDVEWELWYSGDKIKRTEYYEVDEKDDSRLWDPDTGLIVTTVQAEQDLE